MYQFDDYLSFGMMFLGLIFFAIIAVKAFRYWNQLQEGFQQSGMKWPLHSQNEINEAVQRNPLGSHKMMWGDISRTIKILFSMQSDNPLIQKPLRGIRRLFIAFFLFPIVFAVILVLVLALAEV